MSNYTGRDSKFNVSPSIFPDAGATVVDLFSFRLCCVLYHGSIPDIFFY